MSRLSLRAQILILVICVVVVALASLTILTVRQFENELHGSLEQKGLSISHMIAENAGSGLEFEDSSFVSDIVYGAFTDADIQGIAVYDTKLRPVFRRAVNPDLTQILNLCDSVDSTRIQHRADLCIIERPITSRGKNVGCLHLVLSENTVLSRIQYSISIVAIGAVIVLVLIFVAAAIFSQKIVQPIKTFESAASRIRAGDMILPVEIRSMHKDFVHLATAFNDMQAALKKAFEELRESKEHLEEQVLERTKELQNELAERMRAEVALRESEEQLSKAFQNNASLMCISTIEEGRFIDVNEAFLQTLGFERDEVIGRTSFELDLYVNENQRLAINRAVEREGHIRNFEIAVRTKSGDKRYGSYSADIIQMRERRLLLSVMIDTTERREAEQQRRQLQEKLEKAERMESLGILAGGVAHDLNNMLGPLVAYPEMMLEQLEESSPLRKYAVRIGTAARSAATVIQDLLTLARRGRYEKTPLSLNSVVEEYLNSASFLKLSDKHPAVQIDARLEEDLVNVMGSAPHLSKVVMNLVVNAFDAMPEGGTVTVETSSVYVERLQSGYEKIENGNYMLLRVTDTGMGIDSKEIDKIFEPYYSKKKMESSGSGLGLAVVYGVMKDHGGYYDILSEVGKGTEFVLYFPVTTEELDRTRSVLTSTVGGNESVLVVDDSEYQRELASEVLSSLGYVVETAASGRKAVEFLKHRSVNIVMLDMIMEKGFDGLDTYREIIKLHPGQRAIIVSGFSATDRVSEAQALGVGQYVKKPYTRDIIAAAIRDELDRKLATAVQGHEQPLCTIS
jgi:PAS domain S-box-containing protein